MVVINPAQESKNKKKSAIPTRTSVISTRKEWFLHVKCNYHPLSVIFTHECNFDTYEYENDTFECDLSTQSVFYTRRV
jgi:hypothetical protein